MPRFSPHQRSASLTDTSEVESFDEARENGDSRVLSPQAAHQTISQRVLSVYNSVHDIKERINALEQELQGCSRFKYVIHNEIARLAFGTKDYAACAAHIAEAKRLVDQNPNKVANTHYKGAVYYNYSKFAEHVFRDNPLCYPDALSAIEEAIAFGTVDTQTKQDYLTQKAFLLSRLDREEDARDFYEQAFDLDPRRFVEEYTQVGKELLFWVVDTNSSAFLHKIAYEHQKGTIDVNPNVATSMGISPLLAALYNKSGEEVITDLLALGADPFFKGDDSTQSPLVYVWVHEEWSRVKQFLEYLQAKHLEAKIDSFIQDIQNSENYDVIPEEYLSSTAEEKCTELLGTCKEMLDAEAASLVGAVKDLSIADGHI